MKWLFFFFFDHPIEDQKGIFFQKLKITKSGDGAGMYLGMHEKIEQIQPRSFMSMLAAHSPSDDLGCKVKF